MCKALVRHLRLHAAFLKVKMHMTILLLLEGGQKWLSLASAALTIQALAQFGQEVDGCKSKEEGCKAQVTSARSQREHR